MLAPAAGVEPVFLRGHLVTPQHVVFGKIESIAGDVAVINLGYAHGLTAPESLLVVRRVDDELIPIAGLAVLQSEADHSRARVEGPFRVQKNDYVLIHGSRLNLWGGVPRLDRMARQQIVRRQNASGYDTFSTNAELIEEVARDDDSQGRQYQGVNLETIHREAIDKAGSLKSPIGAVAPLAQLDASQGKLAESETPTMDATLLGLSYFAETAKSRNLLLPKISTERLQRLQPVGTQLEVDDQSGPLFREILLRWVNKTIVPRE